MSTGKSTTPMAVQIYDQLDGLFGNGVRNLIPERRSPKSLQ